MEVLIGKLRITVKAMNSKLTLSEDQIAENCELKIVVKMIVKILKIENI